MTTTFYADSHIIAEVNFKLNIPFSMCPSHICTIFFSKSNKIEKALDILLMGMIAWIQCVIRYQIGIRDTNGLFLLIILFKFVEEGSSRFPRYISVKVL